MTTSRRGDLLGRLGSFSFNTGKYSGAEFSVMDVSGDLARVTQTKKVGGDPIATFDFVVTDNVITGGQESLPESFWIPIARFGSVMATMDSIVAAQVTLGADSIALGATMEDMTLATDEDKANAATISFLRGLLGV